jgi:hypothetical protein
MPINIFMIDQTLIDNNSKSITNAFSSATTIVDGLMSVKNVHTDECCKKLENFIFNLPEDQWLPESTPKKDINRYSNRYRINWKSDSIIEELSMSYNAITPLINKVFTRTKEKVFIGLNIWKDTEGFQAVLHRDNGIIAVAMQIYQGKNVPKDCGTRFEIENEMLHVPYEHNSGYVLEQVDDIQQRIVHGTSRPTPKDCTRLSVYAIWSYPEFKD